MSYTKGPWTVADREELETAEPNQEAFGIWSLDENEDMKVRVAKILTTDPDITAEQIKGNALLVAAAPEMYEALLHVGCQCSIAERQSGHLIGCYMPIVQAAIDKATSV